MFVEFAGSSPVSVGAAFAVRPHQRTLWRRAMNKHIGTGLLVGGIFAALITWVAASDAFAEGGFALLASAVFGLAAGLCIGGLIAANFALLSLEEKETQKVVAHREAPAHLPV